ncbi:MAG: AAA family ATPase [Nitrososphaerales archaeon]|jgi:MoxR-like ATPase
MTPDGLREGVLKEVGKVVVDRERETELLLEALLARGHVLLEGVPGVSKTLLAKSFARCVDLGFRRVQFTPDMLPLDIVGGFIFNMKDRSFEFRKGPAFTNILLADEINRAPPKVQSALLESMQEGQVTVEGHTEPLPSPHMVIATQNPIEFQGVYPLPEGQLDRFMLKVVFAYPTNKTEAAIIGRNVLIDDDAIAVKNVVSNVEIAEAIRDVRNVKVSEEMLEYLARLGSATRSDGRVSLGVSPRAMVQLARCAQARAYLSRRDYLIPDDIQELSVEVLSHRVRLRQSIEITDESADAPTIIREIVDGVEPPR